MDRLERELCTILRLGNFVSAPTTEDIVARVRSLAAQSAETHSRLDDAGVAKNLDLPVRVGLLREERDNLAARLNEAEELLRKQCLVNPEDISLPEMMGKAHRAYIVFENRDGSGTKVLLKHNFARGWNGTTTRVIDFHAPDTRPEQPVKLQDLRCPCGGTITFSPNFLQRDVGVCGKCGATCRVLEQPKAEPVTMAPPVTCDQITRLAADLHATGAALGEANRNTAKWRGRAQECQQALRRIRALTGYMSFALDEDWGADDDS